MGSNAAKKEHWQHLAICLPLLRILPWTKFGRDLKEQCYVTSQTTKKLHTNKAKSKKSPGDKNIPAEFWKALAGSDKDLQSEEGQQSFGVWRSVVHEFWEKGSYSSDWLQGRLKMLFKNKGMKPDLGNWRGIMLLDVASKIVCAIISG